MSYSQRRGFGDYQINIPIDQVISRDKQATASKVEQLQGNQTFKANQQQQYLAALSNKHAIEEKNRDTNFRFMQDNYDRIHKAETQEFEQRIKDLDKDRHIEDFGEKLIKAIPGIVDMIPQIAGVVQGAQAEKAKAKKDFQDNLLAKTNLIPKDAEWINSNIQGIKDRDENIIQQLSDLGASRGVEYSPEDIENIWNNLEYEKILNHQIVTSNAANYLTRQVESGEVQVQANGESVKWSEIDTMATANVAVDDLMSRHFPEDAKNAVTIEQRLRLRNGLLNKKAGEINRATTKRNDIQEENHYLKLNQIASDSGDQQGRLLYESWKLQTHNSQGEFDAVRADEAWNRLETLVDGGVFTGEHLRELASHRYKHTSTGVEDTHRGHIGKKGRGLQYEALIRKADDLAFRANYNVERQNAAAQDRLYQAIINPDPNDPEALQQIHALTRPKINEMVKQRWITQEQANNIISRKGHIGIPERPKAALEPGGVLTKEGSADGVRADLKNRLLNSLIDVAQVSTEDLSKAPNFNRSLEQAEALFEYHYEVEKAKPVNKGLDNNSLIEKVFESSTFETRLKSMTPIWEDEDGKALPGHLMKFRPTGLKNAVDPMQIDIDFLDEKFQSAKSRGESGVDVVKKGGLMEDDIKQKQLDRIEHIVSSNNQTGLANYDGILASQYIREIAHRAGQSPIWVANEILKSYGRETIQNQDHILDPNEKKQFSAHIGRMHHSVQSAVKTNTFSLSPYLQPKPGVELQSARLPGSQLGKLNLNNEDWEHLIKTVQGEAGPDDDQYYVAAAILNRVADPRYPNTVKEVVQRQGQFEGYRWDESPNQDFLDRLSSEEGQSKIIEALQHLAGRTDFKGTAMYGNMGETDIRPNDRSNFYHYKEQIGKTDPVLPEYINEHYKKLINEDTGRWY